MPSSYCICHNTIELKYFRVNAQSAHASSLSFIQNLFVFSASDAEQWFDFVETHPFAAKHGKCRFAYLMKIDKIKQRAALFQYFSDLILIMWLMLPSQRKNCLFLHSLNFFATKLKLMQLNCAAFKKLEFNSSKVKERPWDSDVEKILFFFHYKISSSQRW